MAALKSGLVLNENETLVAELEAELWATSSNPIAQFLGTFARIVALFMGRKMHSFLVITDKRVVEVRTAVVCWCCTVSREVKYVLPSSVKEIGYTRSAAFLCCCPAYHLYYQGFTQLTKILLKGVDEAGAKKITDAFYNTIARANA
ncbi:MAG: hypothetical protein LBR16_03320 [Treponema sp.]|nr:hypothetical protein [Treponema sp.]